MIKEETGRFNAFSGYFFSEKIVREYA